MNIPEVSQSEMTLCGCILVETEITVGTFSRNQLGQAIQKQALVLTGGTTVSGGRVRAGVSDNAGHMQYVRLHNCVISGCDYGLFLEGNAIAHISQNDSIFFDNGEDFNVEAESRIEFVDEENAYVDPEPLISHECAYCGNTEHGWKDYAGWPRTHSKGLKISLRA